MPTIREEMALDIANAVALYGQSCEWKRREHPCVRRDEPTMSELQEGGGFIEGAKYFLVVAKSAFAGYDATVHPQRSGVFPKDGDLVNNRTHQVKGVKGHKDPAAAQLVLAIGSADE